MWLSGKLDTIEDAKILSFFKSCHVDLQNVHLPAELWQILHIGALALEAYSLMDTAYSLKSSSPGPFQHIKQFRQVRQSAKTSLKGISACLKALVEDMAKSYKGKNKLEGLLQLKQFNQMEEPLLLEMASQLLESRKTALTQLASSITKRIAGN